MNEALKNKYINDASFVVIDVETTGQSAQYGRITEIGMVKVIDGEVVDEYSTLINPEQFIPKFITDMTGISNEMVAIAPKFSEVKSRIQSFLGDGVFVAHNVSFDYNFVNTSFVREGLKPIFNETLCTVRIARRLLPTTKSKSLESLINYYGIKVKDRHRALDDAKATAQILITFLETLENKYEIETLSDVIAFQYKNVFKLKKPPKNFLALKDTLEDIPEKPGVYFMYNKYNTLIYIGKSKNLKERVDSYFYHNTGHTPKVFEMVRYVQSIKYETTGSELSALLLESELIKKNKPMYNSASKRYRKYPFLKINITDKYPVLSWDYNITDDGSAYYGPFTNREHIEIFLDTLNKLFKLRECNDVNFCKKKNCMYSDINRCLAPCVTNDEIAYREEISKVISFLNGKMNGILTRFTESMNEKAENLQFEEAAEIRDKIALIDKFISKHQYLPYSINDANFVIIVPLIRKSFELFIVKNSKLLKSVVFDSYNDKKISKLLDENHFQDDLFSGKYTKKDFHQFQIILSWIYKNRDSAKVIDINGNTKETLLREIEKYLHI